MILKLDGHVLLLISVTFQSIFSRVYYANECLMMDEYKHFFDLDGDGGKWL
jgi:hypothetical protein